MDYPLGFLCKLTYSPNGYSCDVSSQVPMCVRKVGEIADFPCPQVPNKVMYLTKECRSFGAYAPKFWESRLFWSEHFLIGP